MRLGSRAAVDRDLELAARNMGASPLRTFTTITLPLAAPGIMASAIFVFLESLDEFTGTYFVGAPDVTTLPLGSSSALLGPIQRELASLASQGGIGKPSRR